MRTNVSRYSIAQLFRIALKMAVTAGFTLFAASGCASKTTEGRMLVTETGGSDLQPDWVSGECAAYWGHETKDRICAVGSYSGSTDIGNLRARAIDEGRKKVAAELEARVQAVVEH